MKIKVSVSQYDVSTTADHSIDKLIKIAQQAHAEGVQLLVTPETSIGMLSDVKASGVNYLSELKKIAQDNNLFLSTSFYIKDGSNYFSGVI